MTATAICRHVTVHGRVQGVGYRAWVDTEATARGLHGFVRNRRDGTVEALFCGSAEAVAAMIDRCRIGPSASQVTRVDATDARDPVTPGTDERFAVRPTV